jgi:PAS domain S-box-containing protein
MNVSSIGRESFFSQLFEDGKRVADLAFTDLDSTHTPSSIEPGPFRGAQIAALYGTLPLFVLSHIIVTGTFVKIAHERLQLDAINWWFALALLPVVLLLLLWSRHDRSKSLNAGVAEVRWVELLAILFGVAWAVCPALFFAPADANLRVLIVGVTLAASAVGTFAFARIPPASILYCAFITGSLAMSATRLGGTVGVTFTIFTITYGLVLIGMVLNFHREHLQRAVDSHEMQQQNEIISLLLNDFEKGTRDWLWECDATGNLTYVSPRLAEIVGKQPKDLKNLSLMQSANADISQYGWKQFFEMMASQKPIVASQLEAINAGKKAYWLINAKPLFGEKEAFKGYRGVGRDITAEWETDRKLIEAKEIAEAASAAKSQFLAVMSHELRTPLNSIVGFSEILSVRNDDPSNVDARLDYARTILDSSRHLQNLINDILDATRIENGTISLVEQEIDAAELVEIVVKMCRDQAEKADVTLVAKLVDGIEIRTDITRAKQIILNLLINAIKFSSAGGVVNIELQRFSGNRFAVSIRDGGIGIRPQDLARVFEPFVQAEDGMSRRFSGIGLGLSIARKIARMHGGDVTLESQFGSGTMATFELPESRVSWPSPACQNGRGVAA